jgi:hypothetical protein
MKWQILELNGADNTVSNVRYKVDHDGIETEGYWHFETPKSLDGATEESVIEWIRQATMKNGVNAVESRLMEQVESQLNAIHLPWKAKTFKVTV